MTLIPFLHCGCNCVFLKLGTVLKYLARQVSFYLAIYYKITRQRVNE